MQRSMVPFLASLALVLAFSPGCGDDDDLQLREKDAGAPPTNSACSYIPAGCEVLDPSKELPDVIDRCVQINTSGTYRGRYVHIVKNGALYIDAAPTDLDVDIRVSSMLVEYGGVLQAGSESCPFGGESRSKLAFGLWGNDFTNEGTAMPTKPEEQPIHCETNKGSDHGRCFPAGIDPMAQSTYCVKDDANPDGFDTCNKAKPTNLDGVVNGAEAKNFLLEHYGNLNFDPSPFGYKTLSVSYGGSLRLFGAKGTKRAAAVEPKDGHCQVPTETGLDATEVNAWAQLTGSSWARLEGQTDSGDNETKLTLDREVTDWGPGDEIVVGPTDWYPGHAEQRAILRVDKEGGSDAGAGVKTVLFVSRLAYPHQTDILDLEKMKAEKVTFTGEPKRKAADLRAPVGLLTRSIRIRSLGKTADEPFKPAKDCMITADGKTPDPACYFGGHVMFRQGYRDVQIQGVEFNQLGQGGRIGHYPVHFHMNKSTAYTNGRAFIKDSSIWDSMTRLVALHGSHDITVARNVGFLSTGHGFYGEDGSEIGNKVCHNLAVETRAPLKEWFEAQKDPVSWSAPKGAPAADPPPTARFIPPILDGAQAGDKHLDALAKKTGSDALMPVAFWFMNAHNELVGNHVSGVHGFGSCYWLLGSAISGMSRYEHQFDGLAAYNANGGFMAPLLRFRGNSCSTAALSLPASDDLPPGGYNTGYTEVKNPYVYRPDGSVKANAELGKNFDRPILTGTFRPINPTSPQKNCGSVALETGDPQIERNEQACVTTVIDRYTTSFNWTEVNFSSVWLRPWWYLLTNSAITDQLAAGLTFVSAGSWIQVAPTYFSLVQNSLFAGTTQYKGSPYAKRTGPILRVRPGENVDGGYAPCAMGGRITCNILDQGTGVWTGGFNPKRLLNIYDGPAYASGNTYINVGAWECDPQTCSPPKTGACFDNLPCAADQVDDKATCDREFPCGVYAWTSQPHPQQVPDAPDPTYSHRMVVVDAAIGWKQPNGFYYPPAFAHEKSIFFKEPPTIKGVEGRTNGLNQCWSVNDDGTLDYQPGDCRHNAVDRTRTYVVGEQFNLRAPPYFFRPTATTGPRIDVNPIDFQTILLDLDGTLTGATGTLTTGLPAPNELLTRQPTTSVSRNAFFDAPLQTDECLSFGVQTSPYAFVTSLVAKLRSSPTPEATSSIDGLNENWGRFFDDRGNPNPGAPVVPIYRQLRVKEDGPDSEVCSSVCDENEPLKYGCKRASLMMGPNVGQAVQLTMAVPRGVPDVPGQGLYYIDTNAPAQDLSCIKKIDKIANKPAKFVGGESYVLYNLFARNDTKISYSVYVGQNRPNVDAFAPKLVKVDPHKKKKDAPDYDSLVSHFCDAGTTGACKSSVSYDPTTGVLTVVLDHAKLVDKFVAKERRKEERCLTRDLCRFEGDRCVSCFDAAGKKHPECTMASDTLFSSGDAKALLSEIDDYCKWSTRATGTTTSTLGDSSLVDCPEGGCLGVAFTLPPDFQPKPYKQIYPTNAATACFPKAHWEKNQLAPRLLSTNPKDYEDSLCGKPKESSSFCD